MPARRERYNDPFVREKALRLPNSRTQVAVGRDQERGIEMIPDSIPHQGNGDVDVGLLLLEDLPGAAAFAAAPVLLLKPTVSYLHHRTALTKGIQVVRLPLFRRHVVADARSEVPHLLQRLIGP
jgi:hypothetical protein